MLLEPGSLPSGVDHLDLVTTWSQEPLCLCLCATSHLRVWTGSGLDVQPKHDCRPVQVRKRQSTAEQQQRAAKQQRDKKVQRRDAESMQDDQDVSGDEMTAHRSPEFADPKDSCKTSCTPGLCRAQCWSLLSLVLPCFVHSYSCRMHSCVCRPPWQFSGTQAP